MAGFLAYDVDTRTGISPRWLVWLDLLRTGSEAPRSFEVRLLSTILHIVRDEVPEQQGAFLGSAVEVDAFGWEHQGRLCVHRGAISRYS